MNPKSAALQGGLALLSLGVAYATWQREPEAKKGDVMIADVAKTELTKVRFADDKKWVEIERRKDDDDEMRLWVKLSARPEQKQPERELRGNESAQRLFERFTPMYGRRALGKVEGDKLKELGVDASAKRKLELTTAKGALAFAVGSPGGMSGDPYLRDEKNGNVFLFGSATISDLDSASTRLIERTIHPWKTSDIESVTIAVGGPGGKSRTLAAKPGATALEVKLSRSEKAEKPDEQATAWHQKIWRLLPTDVLGKGEQPLAGAPSLTLRIDYKVKGVKTAFLEVGKVQPPTPPAPAAATTPDGKPAPAPQTPQPEVYLRSESTAGWVKVPSTATALLEEAEKVVAAE